MNILYVLHSDGLAGANRSFLQQLKGIKETDEPIRVYVLVPLEHDEIALFLKEMGCIIITGDYDNCTTVLHGIRESMRYYCKSFHYNNIYNKIKDLSIDIVHTNSSVCDVGAYLATRLKVPHIWHIRENLGYYSMSVIRPLYYRRLMVSKNNYAVCISHYINSYLKGKYNRANSRVVYDAISIDYENKRVEHDGFNLLIAGIIVKNKGIEDAIRALDIIVNQYNIRNVLLSIVGTSIDTSVYEGKLHRIISELGIEEYVRFYPFSDDIDRIRSECDIALQCSIMEGLGRVTIEAMLSKVLVIGAESGATKELIRDGYNGWMYEPGDAIDLAAKIKHVIELDNETVIKVKEDAYMWAKSNFNATVMAKNIIDIYRDAIENYDE